jgi:hypothetical protein
MKFKKGVLVILFILITSIVCVYADFSKLTHDYSNVLIEFNGYSMTLKEAYSNGFLVNEKSLPTKSYTTSVSKGHTANEIIVSVNGKVETLQQAIDSATVTNKGLCSTTGPSSLSTSSLPAKGHLATNIYITSTKTLQQAIDNKEFCDKYTYTWNSGSWGSCSVSCGTGTKTRTITCKRSDGTTVANDYCPETSKPLITNSCDAGNATCGWSSGWTQTTTCSETCGTGKYKRTRTCNIAGHCDGKDFDYNGETCTYYGGCNDQIITLHSRTSDSANQCVSQKYPYYKKAWWWVKGGSGYIDPCETILGSDWEINSGIPNTINHAISSDNNYYGYYCQVDCVRKLPKKDLTVSAGLVYKSKGEYFGREPEQCLDYGWKWLPECPSGYTHYEYELVKDSNGWGCKRNCVKNY